MHGHAVQVRQLLVQHECRAHPLSLESGVIAVRKGTIADMLREAAGGEYRDALRVEVAGHEVPRQWWDRLRPKEGCGLRVED